MSLAHVNSVSQLNPLLSDSNKLTVIDFHATWCGPCHAIAPTFEAMAKQYPNVNFVKCDVDAAKDVASTYKVTAMPTFVFLRGSQQIHTIRGADRTGLQNAVKKFAGSSSASSTGGAFSGRGQTLGGSGSGSGSPPGPTFDLKTTVMTTWSNMDPSFKVLLGLVGAYVFFWLL